MNMNNQEIKMQLLKEFGTCYELKSIDFCREAYKFLTEGEQPVTGGSIEKPESLPAVSGEPQAIDLGLPSGTLWCDRNVGAKSPYEYDGAFFSWGNTEPHYPKSDDDWGYVDEAFDYSFDDATYGQTAGAKLTGDIDLAHDAARVNMGEPWQMPSSEQFDELREHCTWTRKVLDGVCGYLFTSKHNGNSIFFASSGCGFGSAWGARGAGGNYWSASFVSSVNARDLYFYSGGVYPQGVNGRFFGFAVRPVQNIVPKK